ncbi:SOS response-associated peptidase [Paenibacillus lemnae]|uniref:Abasic site processing protein n=1 Tax=Paenibacillus lemnae TaxID=1330551 RepID=A0A848MCD9_PAELE|nr:SOS response-associated peptidase [Paenibacillus lemnae]NMO97104.1 SOS response-associated peptidase [Paenibacillus lemnae]
MCGRFTLTSDLEEIQLAFDIDKINVDVQPRYNIAPSQTVAVIHGSSGHRVLEGYRWGLVPFWAKDKKIGYKTINARAETVQKKPAFRHLIERNRIIIPSDGFYEWKREGKRNKQPYRFQIKSKGLYAFAGLYDEWKSPEGEVLKSCTIITTAANKVVGQIHDRMPVILNQNGVNAWLDPEFTDKQQLQDLLIPYPDDLMVSYPVSKDVGNVKNTNAELIKEVTLNSK